MRTNVRTKTTSKKKTTDYTVKLAIIVLGTFVVLILSIVLLNLHTAAAFCANSVSCIHNLTGIKEQENTGVYMGQKVTAPVVLPGNQELAISNTKSVLGMSTGGFKHIYVSLPKQALYAYEGNTLVYSFPISSGKWHPTPTGDFRIWVWLWYTHMTGGDISKGTYYDLPNVPYTMYISNASVPKSDGYSIHGAYWHNNFGHPMSHGCINMSPADAAKIFYWTNPLVRNVAYPTDSNPGTLITIYGNPPVRETDFID